MKHLSVALLIAAVAFPASAQLPPLVKSAFDALGHDSGQWAYTRTTVAEGTKTVERFDPSRPEGQQSQLILKDGHAPSASELAAYAEKHSRGHAKGKRMEFELSKLIRPGSLHLIRESAADAVYEFRLPVDAKAKDDEKEMVDSMKGRLTIVKNGPWLQVLEIDNEKPIKPVATVKIDRMYTKTTFQAPAAGAPALVAEVRVTVRGRALFVKKLDADSVVTYSDYRLVGGGH